MDIISKSPLPFPLLKGWTRACYKTWFGGEFKFSRWIEVEVVQPYLVVRGHALYVVAVWSRATYLVVRGHALYVVAVWSRATYLVVRGHALYVVAVWSRATYLVVRGHALYLVAVWSLVVRGAIKKKQLNLFLAGHLRSKFCSEVLAQSQFATISRESCLARFGHVQKLQNIFNQFWVKLNKNEWQGKMAMENCPWNWVPDKVETLQNGPGFFFEHECKCSTQPFLDEHIKIVLDTRVQDSWQGTPFCRVEFVAIPFCRLEKDIL